MGLMETQLVIKQVMANLPSSFAIDVTNGVDKTYAAAATSQLGVKQYFAASPEGDLAGRPTCKVRHSVSASGLVSTNVQFRTPILNGVTEKYDSWIQGDIKLTRSDLHGTAAVEDMIETLEEFLEVADVRAALASGNY
jgi:hypothetical protein